MRAGSMVLAMIVFFAAGSSAGEDLSQSAPSAAGAFTGEAAMRGAQGPLGRSQDQATDGDLPAGAADLSDRRIDSVREALIAAGVPAYKIYTGTFGDPLLRRERRVEVLFSPRD